MTIDQTTGAIYIVFYDRRNTSGNATDVYVARSTNGGETFTNFKVSESSFIPSSNIFFGDYTNIAAFNKKVYPIWMRLDGSALSVWTAIINDSLVFVPVELESFTASKLDDKKVLLSWQTASEINNRGFEVQRKFHNSDYVTIGFVDGKGTTSEKQYYNFTDTPFEDGVYSYRLKQIDYDGKFQFSNEVEINLQTVSFLFLEQNYPNPFNNRTVLRFATADTRWITLKLYDMLGREVLTFVNEILEPGIYEREINFSEYSFPTGMYFYELNDGRSTIVKKLIYMK
ncbi:MAG: hypothetical protein KatS3mg036_0849 [Ignavibacterium sp.]|nr:MAG: hypothetical protein KatS3mg036_0849 [Ignavibacterium sp.]